MSTILPAAPSHVLVYGPPSNYQTFIAREVIGEATRNGGSIVFLTDTVTEGVAALREFASWETGHNIKAGTVQLNVVPDYQAFTNVAALLSAINTKPTASPLIVVRDIARSLLAPAQGDRWWNWAAHLKQLRCNVLSVANETPGPPSRSVPFGVDASYRCTAHGLKVTLEPIKPAGHSIIWQGQTNGNLVFDRKEAANV